MNRNDLPETDAIRSGYPEFKNEDVKWLWHSDYYDGPLSLMVKINDKKYWAEFIDEIEWTEQYGPEPNDVDLHRARFFVVLDPGQERIEYEEYWHELFRTCVGTHTDYDESGTRNTGKVIPQGDSWKFFYGRYKADYEEMNLKECSIIGWFVW